MMMMMMMMSAGNFLRPGWCNGHYGGDERGIIRLIRRRGNRGYGVMTMTMTRRKIMMTMKIMVITEVMLIIFRKKRGMRNSVIVMVNDVG